MQTSTKITHQSDFLYSQYVNPSGICINLEHASTFAHLSLPGSQAALADPAFIPAHCSFHFHCSCTVLTAYWVQLDLEEQSHSSLFQALSHLHHLFLSLCIVGRN